MDRLFIDIGIIFIALGLWVFVSLKGSFVGSILSLLPNEISSSFIRVIKGFTRSLTSKTP